MAFEDFIGRYNGLLMLGMDTTDKGSEFIAQRRYDGHAVVAIGKTKTNDAMYVVDPMYLHDPNETQLQLVPISEMSWRQGSMGVMRKSIRLNLYPEILSQNVHAGRIKEVLVVRIKK